MNISIRTPDQIELDALRGEVLYLLEFCTEKQKAFFSKLYPDVNKMDREKLRNAVGLCQRTVRKNETGDMYGAMPPSQSETP